MLITQVTLKRKKRGNYQNLLGRLKITTNVGEFHFSTMENYVHRIKQGVYNIKYTYSPRFKRKMLQVMVSNRTGIRIHSANKGSELLGCIAIGSVNTNNDADQIYFSRDNTDIVESMLYDKDVQLEIIDDYENNDYQKTSSSSITEAFRFGA